MNRSDLRKLKKMKQRNAKVAKVVAITSLSAVLIAPSILGAISVVMAEETNPTEQVDQTEKELFTEAVAPLDGEDVISTEAVTPVTNDVVDLPVETVPEAAQVAETQAQIQEVVQETLAQSLNVTINWVVNDYEKTATFSDGTSVLVRDATGTTANVEIGGIYTPNAIATTVGTHTFTMSGEDIGNENTYTVTLVVTDELTVPDEKPKAPQSVSATDDGKFVYASGEQGTSVFVKDEKGTIISSYTSANGVGTPVQIILNRALTKGEKVQVVAVNQMTDKQSDPTWFTFKVPTEVTNKVVGLDLATGAELYSYNEKGLEGATKEITARDVADYGLSVGETKVKTMTFGSNGNVTFYYTKKTTPPVAEKTQLTVKHIDVDTKAELSPATTTEVESGVPVKVGSGSIKGYTVVGDKEVTVTPTGKTQTVTFEYKKDAPVKETTQLTVKHIDVDTKAELISSTTTEVESGKAVKVEADSIKGYTLVGDNEVTVTPEGATQTVTFEYKKDADIPTPTEKTKLTVDFVDMETGKKVSESVVSEVEQGKETTVKAKDIKGFVLQGKATVKVTPTEANHTITFAYKKEIVNVVLDNATNVKFVEKSDGKQITATVPKGLTLVIVKNGTVIGKSSNGLFARLLTDEVTINLDTRVAKGETIEYFTEDTEGNSSATANLTREGQEPVDPTEPTEPTNPTNPVDPTDPSTPKPVEPTNPTEPSKPDPVVHTTGSTTDTKNTVKPVNKVDGKNEKLIPQLGESNNMLTAIGIFAVACVGFVASCRKKIMK